MDLEPVEWLSEHDIAATVLGTIEPPRRPAPRLTSVIVGAAASELERLVRQRTVMRRRDGGRAHRAVWSPPQHRTSAAACLVVLYALPHCGAQGRIAEETCCALLVHAGSPPHTRRDWQAWVNRLDTHTALQAAITGEGSTLGAEIDRRLDPFRISVRRRVRLIMERLHRSPCREPQSSLFHRRVERRAAIRQHVVERLDAALLRRVQSLTPPPLHGIAPHARLIAVWPFER